MYAELDKDAMGNGWNTVRALKQACAIQKAVKALKSQGKHSLAETLQLIYKYGNDRNRSIRALALAEKTSKMTMKNKSKSSLDKVNATGVPSRAFAKR